MLIIVLALCLGTSLFVALRRRDSLSLYLLGMSVSNSIMLAGVIIYIAKMGAERSENDRRIGEILQIHGKIF